MQLVKKILLLSVCLVGALCAIAALITNRGKLEASIKSKEDKTTIACTFLALFIVAAVAVLIFLTLCCACTDLLVGIVAAISGGTFCVFMVIAYAAHHKVDIDLSTLVPLTGEWLFGGIITGFALLILSVTVVLP